jgi:hypothetical protein
VTLFSEYVTFKLRSDEVTIDVIKVAIGHLTDTEKNFAGYDSRFGTAFCSMMIGNIQRAGNNSG